MCGLIVLWLIALGIAMHHDLGAVFVYGTLIVGALWLYHVLTSDDSSSGRGEDSGGGGMSGGRSGTGFGGDGDGDGGDGGGDGGGSGGT